MDALLRALSDGTRRQILTLVWHEERTAGDIAAKFAMTRPSISQHLAVLLQSELVSVRRSGTRRLYRANRQAVARLRAELAVLWDDSLARLKTAIEVPKRKRRKR
jgi:DNA-binding transcriptional ArsR family regulator